MLTIRQLIAIREVARMQNFTGAALRLHTTQSNISIAIQEAENILGSRLFERTTKSFRLTNAGLDFVPVVERILDDLQAGIKNIQASSALQKGVLTLGATPLIISTLLCEYVAQYKKKFPKIDIRIEDASTDELAQLLRNRSLEFAIGPFTEKDEGLNVEPLFEDSLTVLAHAATGLSGKCTWSQLLDHPLVSISSASTFGQLINSTVWTVTGTPYSPMLEVKYWSSVISFAKSLSTACIVPEYASHLGHDKLRKVQLIEPRIVRTISIAYLTARELSPAGRAFLEFVLNKNCNTSKTKRK